MRTTVATAMTLLASPVLTASTSMQAAWAQQAPALTIASLLKQGFTVAGVTPSAVGVGIFLVKGDQMYGCFAAETTKSPEIATKYCKPVR